MATGGHRNACRGVCVDGLGDRGGQQLYRGVCIEPRQFQSRDPRELRSRFVGIAGTEQKRRRLGLQSARHKREHLARLRIQPVRVVDRADHRAPAARGREQAEHAQSDEELIRRWTVFASPCHPQGLLLSRGQGIDVVGQ
jgi:hypothetical protein